MKRKFVGQSVNVDTTLLTTQRILKVILFTTLILFFLNIFFSNSSILNQVFKLKNHISFHLVKKNHCFKKSYVLSQNVCHSIISFNYFLKKEKKSIVLSFNYNFFKLSMLETFFASENH